MSLLMGGGLWPLTVRASSAATFVDCPRRWAAQALRGTIEALGYALRSPEPGIGAAVGSGVHRGAETHWRDFIARGGPGDEADAIERGIEELRHRLRERGTIYDQTTPGPSQAEHAVGRMTRAYRDAAVRTIKTAPRIVEGRVACAVEHGRIELAGHPDLLLDAGGLRDIKTGRRTAVWNVQLGCYSLLLRAAGEPVRAVGVDFAQRVPSSKDQPPVVGVAHRQDIAERAAHRALRGIREAVGEFSETRDPWAFVANPSSMLCSDRYCPAHGTRWCMEHRGGDNP
jgi:hypothetical protein